MKFRTAAIVIGVNRSVGQEPLRNAEHDARDLAVFLRGPLAPIGPEDLFLVLGSRATIAGVRDTFRRAARRKPDLLIVVFSGHGGTDSVCLSDGALDHRTLATWITDVGATRGMVIIDACHAGAFSSQFELTEVGALPDEDWQNALATMLPGMRLLLASRHDELASDGAGRNGAFTAALLQALRRLPGDLTEGKQSYVSAEAAVVCASALVQQRSRGAQTPLAYGRVADFPLARPQRRANTAVIQPSPRVHQSKSQARATNRSAGGRAVLGTALLGLLAAGGFAYTCSRRSTWDSSVGQYRGRDGRFR